LIRRCVGKFNRGDLDAAVGDADPSIEWHDLPELPGAAVYYGLEATTGHFRSAIEPKYGERRDGDPTAALRILGSVEGEDALRVEQIVEQLGQTPHDVVFDLLRDAGHSAA
jgi:hypothetical protein